MSPRQVTVPTLQQTLHSLPPLSQQASSNHSWASVHSNIERTRALSLGSFLSYLTHLKLCHLITDHNTMGMVYRIYLEGERIYGCANCKTHLATIHSMMSRVSSAEGPLRWMNVFIERDKTCIRPSMDSTVGRTYSTECMSSSTRSTVLFMRIFVLFSVNVVEGDPIDREMTTGKHTVRDISCCKCRTVLGWKYASFPFHIHI